MRLTLRKFLIFLLVFASLIPNIGIKVNTFGFNWTLYRASIVVGIFLFMQLSKNRERLIPRPPCKWWITLMGWWILYGIVLLIVSPYKDLHKGFVELMSLFNGLVCIWILTSVLQEARDLEQIISIVQVVFMALVVWGCIECLTGIHLPMSIFRDDNIVRHVSQYSATGIFYGENDFSAFLTCLLPIMFYRKRGRLLSIFMALGVIYICYINDANICLMALMVGVGYYFIFIKKYGKNRGIIVRCCLLTLVIGLLMYIWINLKELAKSSNLLFVIYTQYSNISLSSGSMYSRIVIYLDSLKAAVYTFFLGIGPSAFSNYFYTYPSKSGLVNPHNLYLEMLVEYGLIITVAFVAGLIKMIHGLRRKAIGCHNKSVRLKYIAGCEMLVMYSMVCIAPSSFIGYAWQWIILTIGIALLGTAQEKLVASSQKVQCYVPKRTGYMDLIRTV